MKGALKLSAMLLMVAFDMESLALHFPQSITYRKQKALKQYRTCTCILIINPDFPLPDLHGAINSSHILQMENGL